MKLCVYGASSSAIDKSFIQAGEQLGRRMAERGHSLVFGGGGLGMMGAVARGALSGGAEIIGVVPDFFEVDGILFDHCTKIFRPQTMRQRKQMLEERSDGFIVAPGGIGTMDEFFEILTLKQLGRHTKPIVVWNVQGCYDELLNMMIVLTANGFIREACRELYYVTESAEDALDYMADYVPGEPTPGKYKIFCDGGCEQ